jgi:hypothetical protein
MRRFTSTFTSNQRSPRRRGFALVDVMVGGVMLGIGLAVVISAVSRSMAAHTDGEKRVVASWLADEILNMVVVEGPVVYPKINDMDGRFGAPFEEFAYSINIESMGIDLPFEVSVAIWWDSPEEAVVVDTIIAERRGEEFQPRAPLEPIDREGRYFEDDEEQ